MKNFKKLGLVLSVGTIAAFTLVGCGDDDDTTTTTGGTGTTAGTTSTGGGGTGTVAGSTSTGGGGTGTVAGSTSTGGGGSSATGGGGAGGKGGSGGTGGTGGASGGSGGSGGASGGSGGSGGAAPSADCKMWCEGDTGLVKKCMGSNLLNPAVDSVAKCEAHCADASATGDKGLSCWIKHTGFITDMASQDPHCGHASGNATSDAGNTPCNIIN